MIDPHFELVEDAEDRKIKPSFASERVLEFLAHALPHEIETLIADEDEPFAALKDWAEQRLGVRTGEGEYLGYAIQAIVEDKLGSSIMHFKKAIKVINAIKNKADLSEEEMDALNCAGHVWFGDAAPDIRNISGKDVYRLR